MAVLKLTQQGLRETHILRTALGLTLLLRLP